MYSITLQNPSDSIIASGDKLGCLNFAAPYESDGGAAKAIIGSIYSQSEGTFNSTSSPASIIFGTSNSDALGVINRLKITEGGNFHPMSSGSYDIGSSPFPFRNVYATTGNFNITQYGASKPTLTTDTDGTTITFNMNTSDIHTVTLGGNRTLAVSNVATGQKFIIRLLQDGTGSRIITWFSTIKWPGGLVPTLTTTANKSDTFAFICTGTNAYDGYVIGYNL